MWLATLVSVCLTATDGGPSEPTPPPGRVSVSVVLLGDPEPVAAAREALGKPDVLPVELHFAEVPNLPPADPGTGDTEVRLAAARRDYIGAKFRSCLERVPRGELASGLLGAGQRALAARVLFWRIACQVGEGSLEEARLDARAFAAFELEVPPDVEKASPEVEALLASAMKEAAAATRVPLRVTASLLAPPKPVSAASTATNSGATNSGANNPGATNSAENNSPANNSTATNSPANGSAVPPAAAASADGLHASVAVDGRPGLCVTPCELPRRQGDHVLRIEADGATPEVRLVHAGATGVSTAVELTVASPELAARQWTERYATSPAVDSSPSARLLAGALRERRVALVVADGGDASSRLRGVLVIDGDVAARGERTGKAPEIGPLAPELLRDLLVKGAVVEPAPPLYRQPLFWIITVAVVAATATTTALVAYPRPVHTVVKF